MSTSPASADAQAAIAPTPLAWRRPADWLRVIGPGAVIASLTIGAGELVFSSRAGAVFGYDLLWFFGLILFAKWVLLYSAGRQMILAGTHPFQLWVRLPGPRGWLPATFLMLAAVAFPIWVSFHAGTVGTLLAWLAGTEGSLGATAHYLWGIGVLGLVFVLALRGGYAALERIQLVIVGLMLLAVVVCFFLLGPPWAALFKGLFVLQLPAYPPWAAAHPEFQNRPVWVEAVTYIGVVGGSAYDYLAYVSYLRDKRWGQAGAGPASPSTLEQIASFPDHPHRRWLSVMLVDSALSFAAVFLFTMVFVTCGALILAPQHHIPSGTNLLRLQADFVGMYPWMKPLYFAGALLTMLGTLYGTIEVAPAVLREAWRALKPRDIHRETDQSRRWAVIWTSTAGLGVLAATFIYARLFPGQPVPGLVAMLTPANLFTGVLACGLVCLLNPWCDRQVLPKNLRMGTPLVLANWLAAVVFLLTGAKAYWDHSQWRSLALLFATAGLGAILGLIWQARPRRD